MAFANQAPANAGGPTQHTLMDDELDFEPLQVDLEPISRAEVPLPQPPPEQELTRLPGRLTGFALSHSAA